jgi:hypothetical protein
MSLLPKFWIFGANLDEVRQPQSWRVTMRPFLGDSPFFMEQATYALNCFQTHVVKLCTSITLSLRGKKNPTQIGHHM